MNEEKQWRFEDFVHGPKAIRNSIRVNEQIKLLIIELNE